MLFVTHDFAVARFLCDDIAVMYKGRIVERAPAEALFTNPQHPYTEALLSAVPSATVAKKPFVPFEEHPERSAWACPFAPRCRYASEQCKSGENTLKEVFPRHACACGVLPFNQKRLVETFVELARIDSESFFEKDIQQFLAAKLKELGCKVQVDNAGKKYNTTAQGNVIGLLPGTIKSASIVLSSHMDTVVPGKGVKPVVKKDKITSDGTTVLGADDKAGIAPSARGSRFYVDRRKWYGGSQKFRR